MWEFKNYKQCNEMTSLEMILIEEKVLPFHFYVIRHCWMVWLLGIHLPINIKQGTLVHAVILRNQVNRFRANLYSFSAAHCDTKIQEDNINIPSNGLQFIKQNIIRSTVNNNTFLTGILIHISYVTHIHLHTYLI